MGTYEDDAQAAVAALLREHPGGSTDGELLGGKVNRVLAGSWEGTPAVFKYYADHGGMHLGCPADRQERDRQGSDLLSWHPLVPRCLACFPERGISIVERFPGTVLEPLGRDRPIIAYLGLAAGRTWAELLGRVLPIGSVERYRAACGDGLDRAATVDRLFARAEALLAAWGEPAFPREVLELIRPFRGRFLEGPDRVLRLDNNDGNFLHLDGRLTSVIDWEQCWLGSELMQVGVLLDREAASLPGLMAGYCRARGRAWSEDEWAVIHAAAELSAWWRVLWNGYAWRAEHDGYGFDRMHADWVERLTVRISRLRELAPVIRSPF